MAGTEQGKQFQIIKPLSNGNLYSEWQSCLNQLKAISCYSIIKISVFVDQKHWEEAFIDFTSELIDIIKIGCPAFTFIAQAPDKHNIALEVVYINNTAINISYKSFQNIPYTVIECNGNKELWASGLGLLSKMHSVNESASYAFEQMLGLLECEGMTMNNIVRQWNYIPKILNLTKANGKELQNYQIFNEVRRHYYQNYRTVRGYPAATGIGVSTGSVSIDICAIASDSTELDSINNPHQVNAYQYQQEVLVGELIEGTTIKQAPQFERAKLITSTKSITLFVSGTAAIKGQNTMGIDDVEAQTHITLELIEQLCQEAIRVKKVLKGMKSKVDYVRVYVKNKEDIDAVETICRKNLKDTPVCIVQADICRNNLLVEIESEISFKTNNSSINIKGKECMKLAHKV